MRRPKTFSLLAALLVACSAAVPAAVSPTPFETPFSSFTPSPTPTPKPQPAKSRSVSALGGSFVATGDFRGSGDTQAAIIEDPTLGMKANAKKATIF